MCCGYILRELIKVPSSVIFKTLQILNLYETAQGCPVDENGCTSVRSFIQHRLTEAHPIEKGGKDISKILHLLGLFLVQSSVGFTSF